jgi:hypothetical protein
MVALYKNALAYLSAQKFRDPRVTADGQARATVELEALEILWLNTGPLCNILFARPALYRSIHGGSHVGVKETLHDFGRDQEGRNHNQQKREIDGRRMDEFEPAADPRQEG